MPKFTFTSPEGKTYDVEGPDGATKEQAFLILQQRLGPNGAGAPSPAPGGTAAPASKPAEPPQSIAGFIGGNLSKGVADVAGLPVDLAHSAIEGTKGIANLFGAHLKQTDSPVGGSDWIKQKLAQIGSIGPSAEPRTTAQRYAAAGLEAGPSAVLPGGTSSVLPRIGSAIGSGLGGQAAREMGGGYLGQIAGSMLGGAAGGMIGGAERSIPPPPSEAGRASQASGIPLTLGQETGSKSLTSIENRLRELFPSRGTANADELAQAQAAVNRVNELAGQVQGASGNAEQAGMRLRSAYNDAVQRIDTARDAQAARDYGEVRRIAGNQPVIRYSNTLNTLDRIIAENQNVPAGDATRIAAQARQMREALAGQGTATVDDAMRTRRAWGNAARRTGNVFSDIDPNANQLLARRLFGAINQDFDAASNANTPISQALRRANQNYANASQSISYIERSALGKLLGEDVTDAAFSGQTASTKAPEAIAKRYLNMTPSEARSVTTILRRHAPDVLQQSKAFVLLNGLESARNDVPGAAPISFAKFRRELDKVQPKLREMGFTPREIRQIADATDTMARAGDRTGANPSGTTAAGHMLGTAAIALAHPVAAAASVITPYIASRALLTEPGRELLRNAYAASTPAARNAAIGALRSRFAQSQGPQQ
ncbi:hypothetical protein CUJ91_04855 [Paraburkholderia graminis]|uniref:hypothetical protein n=1 Tax=Paraburkholderia graminis TaxID=60548 RepID=UPI000DEF03A8|nr:hypothetical protein [Paraburkholderia graminis]AXF07327.1 hypothetical protein CUJ91_04855 [Paraburkholderia graminis]